MPPSAAELPGAGSGDIHFTPEHARRDEQYRRHLLGHVVSRRSGLREVYVATETSDTGFLMDLLLDLMARGLEPTFAAGR